MFVSFPTFKPSPCERFLVIRTALDYSTNSHGVFDAIIDKVNAGVSGQTFVYPLKIAFYLYEYVTT